VNKALFTCTFLISMLIGGVAGLTSRFCQVKAAESGIVIEGADCILPNSTEYSVDLNSLTMNVAPRIVVEHADYVSTNASEYSSDLINMAKNVTPRITLQYGEFVSKLDLNKLDGLDQVANVVSSRISVEYADYISKFDFQVPPDLDQVASTAKSRIVVGYADSIIATDLQRPLYLPPGVRNITVAQRLGTGIVDISYEVFDARQSVTTDFQYWSGSSWIDCATIMGGGAVSVGNNTGTWSAKADYNGYYTTSMKIRIIADNGEATYNIGLSESPIFSLDTNNPSLPNLLLPSNGTATNNATPNLDWLDVSDPSNVSYSLELDKDASFSSPELQKTMLTVSQYTTPSQEALEDGIYYWRLKAVDGMGNQDGWSLGWFSVDTVPPVANAKSDQTVNEDTPVTFDGSSSWDKSGISSYTWAFTNEKAETLSGMINNYTFVTPGIYTITLKASDPAGNSAMDTMIITVLDKTKPMAEVTYDISSHLIEYAVTFDASASSDNVGILSYEWNFGDGTSATGQTVSHTYSKAGVYNVTLTVQDAARNANTNFVAVTIIPSTSPWQMLIFLVFVTILGISATLAISLRKRKQIAELNYGTEKAKIK